MKIELTKEQEEKILKAVREFNNWQGHAVIMFDTSDNDCWCNVYASDNDWTEYHSNTIYTVISKDNLYGRNTKISKAGALNIIKNMHFVEYKNMGAEYMSDKAIEAYMAAEY